MKLYISGPMTGHVAWNFPSFFAAEEALTAAGIDTVNPARHGSNDDPDHATKVWADWMRRDVIDLMGCDGVATLDEWWLSRGATVEVSLAAMLDLPVRPVAEWCRMGNALPLERGMPA